MDQTTNWAKEQAGNDDRQAEVRLRGIFLASVISCVLIAGMLMLLPQYAARSPMMARVAMLPLLLWSLAVTSYAFRSLWLVAGERKAKLQELVRRDTLTGALTSDALFDILEDERQRALTSGQVAVVGFVRAAGVEDVNTSFGHAAGNLVLRELVQTMAGTLPAGGQLARLGGQEFIVFLPQTPLADGQDVLRKLRDTIREYTLDLGKRGTIGGMDASVGAAAFPVDGESGPDIVSAAQEKLLVDM